MPIADGTPILNAQGFDPDLSVLHYRKTLGQYGPHDSQGFMAWNEAMGVPTGAGTQPDSYYPMLDKFTEDPVANAIRFLKKNCRERVARMLEDGTFRPGELDLKCVIMLQTIPEALQNKVIAHLDSERPFFINARSKAGYIISTCDKAKRGELDVRGFGAVDPYRHASKLICQPHYPFGVPILSDADWLCLHGTVLTEVRLLFPNTGQLAPPPDKVIRLPIQGIDMTASVLDLKTYILSYIYTLCSDTDFDEGGDCDIMDSESIPRLQEASQTIGLLNTIIRIGRTKSLYETPYETEMGSNIEDGSPDVIIEGTNSCHFSSQNEECVVVDIYDEKCIVDEIQSSEEVNETNELVVARGDECKDYEMASTEEDYSENEITGDVMDDERTDEKAVVDPETPSVLVGEQNACEDIQILPEKIEDSSNNGGENCYTRTIALCIDKEKESPTLEHNVEISDDNDGDLFSDLVLDAVPDVDDVNDPSGNVCLEGHMTELGVNPIDDIEKEEVISVLVDVDTESQGHILPDQKDSKPDIQSTHSMLEEQKKFALRHKILQPNQIKLMIRNIGALKNHRTLCSYNISKDVLIRVLPKGRAGRNRHRVMG